MLHAAMKKKVISPKKEKNPIKKQRNNNETNQNKKTFDQLSDRLSDQQKSVAPNWNILPTQEYPQVYLLRIGWSPKSTIQ